MRFTVEDEVGKGQHTVEGEKRILFTGEVTVRVHPRDSTGDGDLTF